MNPTNPEPAAPFCRKHGIGKVLRSGALRCPQCTREADARHRAKRKLENPKQEGRRDYNAEFRHKYKTDPEFRERVLAKNRAYIPKDKNRRLAKNRASYKKSRRELQDWYIIRLIRDGTSLKRSEIPPDLIRLKRVHLELKRTLKQIPKK